MKFITIVFTLNVCFLDYCSILYASDTSLSNSRSYRTILYRTIVFFPDSIGLTAVEAPPFSTAASFIIHVWHRVLTNSRKILLAGFRQRSSGQPPISDCCLYPESQTGVFSFFPIHTGFRWYPEECHAGCLERRGLSIRREDEYFCKNLKA